jgi:hypothetical protein
MGSIQQRQVVEGLSHIRVVVAQGLFPYRQTALDQRLRFLVLPLVLIQPRQVVEGLRVKKSVIPSGSAPVAPCYPSFPRLPGA